MGKLLQRIARRPTADNTANSYINQVIGNKADAAAAGAVSETDTLVAYIKQLVKGQREWVSGLADTSPLATMNLFTVAGGPVVVHDIIGIVSTVIENKATTVVISLDPTDGGSDVALCTAVDADNDATGTIIRVTRDFSEAAIALLDASEVTDYHSEGIILMPGNIIVTYGDTSTGVIDWYCQWTSITGTLVAATTAAIT
jgi:hypothetical protein